MRPEVTVFGYVKAINTQDVDLLLQLMTEDHVFIDSVGVSVRGAGAMRKSWIDYFQMMPDYRIDIHESFTQGNVVILIGHTSGTFAPDGKIIPENRWDIPAAWRAVVRGDRVKSWQVFADNEPIRRIIREKKRKT